MINIFNNLLPIITGIGILIISISSLIVNLESRKYYALLKAKLIKEDPSLLDSLKDAVEVSKEAVKLSESFDKAMKKSIKLNHKRKRTVDKVNKINY
jgi:hypothetical protein